MADTYRGRERIRGVAHSTKRAALKLRRPMTATEQKLWTVLRGRQFQGYKFRRQHPLGRFILDFYCPECRLVIELDGAIHRLQVESDRFRDEHLAAYGLRLLRISNDDVEYQLPVVLKRIHQALDESWSE